MDPSASSSSATQQHIAAELRAVLQRHGCDLETADRLCALPPAEVAVRAYEVLEILGSRPHLLAIVASYGEALDDESVLELLRIAHPSVPTARRRNADGSNRAEDCRH